MSGDVTTVTLEEAKEMESRTDWEALEEKTDEQIRKDVESDPTKSSGTSSAEIPA